MLAKTLIATISARILLAFVTFTAPDASNGIATATADVVSGSAGTDSAQIDDGTDTATSIATFLA